MKLPAKGSMAKGISSRTPDATRTGKAGGARRWWFFAGLLVFFAVACVAYAPALKGGFLWDDDGHVTRAELRGLEGLFRIWFEVGATQQYYPLLHSAFWVEHRLWGDAVLGYHLINVFQHALAAVLFARLLTRLAVPGAWLAASLFLLHPVCVESVAWISEQKNTLSLVLYLLAAHLYLSFDDRRSRKVYLLASVVFVLALLTKTVTASLPAALLVVFWWKRGTLAWRREVFPLLPWFALGACAGLFTAWVERKLLGADGAEFSLGLLERVLVAGRVVWFYLGKLVWPAELTFVYPRWTIDATVWWQWLFPLGAAGLLGVLFYRRDRTRAPLAAALLFGGTLFPVLGFLNVYPFIFSFVADHFQYAASLAVFALGGAAMWQLPRGVAVSLASVLLCILGGLTFQQAAMYRDEFTLYETTLRRNPDCWMAHNNLAIALVEAGRAPESIPHYQAALRLRPNYARGEHNLGFALNHLGRYAEAVPHLERSIQLNPNFASAHNELGSALLVLGRTHEGMEHLRKALQLAPGFGMAHRNLAYALAVNDRVAESLPHFEQAVRILPHDVELRVQLSLALAILQRSDEAIAQLHEALKMDPRSAAAHYQLSQIYHAQGKTAEAARHLQESLRLDPQIAR